MKRWRISTLERVAPQHDRRPFNVRPHAQAHWLKELRMTIRQVTTIAVAIALSGCAGPRSSSLQLASDEDAIEAERHLVCCPADT